MKICLSEQEKKWLTSKRYKRLTDGQPILISPMGSERFLYSVLCGADQKISLLNKFVYSWLFGLNKKRFNLKSYIIDKNVLVIPGYANNSFILAHSDAKSVTVFDKDPITIAWLKAIKKYYNYSQSFNSSATSYPSIGDILNALTAWYPPLIKLPKGNLLNLLLFFIYPNELRHRYLNYMVQLIADALQKNISDGFELDKKISFFVGDDSRLNDININSDIDTVYIPYLLGVENGISNKKNIINFIESIFAKFPNCNIFITPSRGIKQFSLVGHKYLVADNIKSLKDIDELKKYFIGEDNQWLRTQGLMRFKKNG